MTSVIKTLKLTDTGLSLVHTPLHSRSLQFGLSTAEVNKRVYYIQKSCQADRIYNRLSCHHQASEHAAEGA